MLQCELCGTDLIDGRCPSGHAVDDASVVVPAGGSSAAMVEPSGGERVIKIGTSHGFEGAGSLLGEALGDLNDDEQVEPEPEPDQPEPVEASAPEELVAAAPTPAAPVVEPEAPVYPSAQADEFAGAFQAAAAAPVEEEQPEPESPVEAPTAAVPIASADLIGKPATAGREVSKKLLVVPLILAVLGGAGVFFVFGGSGTAEAASYRRVFTAEETHRYNFQMSMVGTVEAGPVSEPMNVTMAMDLTEQTLAVDADGIATVRQTVDGLRMSVNGQRTQVPVDGFSVTLQMAPDGRVLSIDGVGGLGLGDAGPVADLFGPSNMGPLLPSGKVAPGDEWTVKETVPNPLLAEGFTVTARNRLVERKTVDGVETALIRSTLDMPMDMTISMRKLLELAEEAAGQSIPDGGMLPGNASIVYRGGMTMELLQTVQVATSRPTRVVGSGDADLRMRLEGVPGGMPEVSMKMRMTVEMTELAAPARAASGGFAPDPLLDA